MKRRFVVAGTTLAIAGIAACQPANVRLNVVKATGESKLVSSAKNGEHTPPPISSRALQNVEDRKAQHGTYTPDPNGPKGPIKGNIRATTARVAIDPRWPSRSHSSQKYPVPGSGDWGMWIKQVGTDNTRDVGVYAGQKIRTNLDVPNTTSTSEPMFLYAPTMAPPNKVPLESVTVYRKFAGETSTTREWGVWDHTTGTWAVNTSGTRILEQSDTTAWWNKYVRLYPEGYLYYTKIERISGISTAYLWNFTMNSGAGAWEAKFSRSGGTYLPALVDGWNMFETTGADVASSCLNLDSNTGGYDYVRSTEIKLNKYDGFGYNYLTNVTASPLVNTSSTCINGKTKAWVTQWRDWYVSN